MGPFQPPQEISRDELLSSEMIASAKRGASPGTLAKMIFWRRLGLLLAVFFVIWGPINLGVAYLEQNVIDEDDFQTSWRIERQANLWLGIICTGAAVSVVAATYEGRSRSFAGAMADGLRRWPQLWTTYFVYGVAVVLGFVVLIFPGIYIAVRGFYALTIAAAEGVHGPTAINRSFEITRGRFSETLGRALIVLGVYVLASILLGTILLPLLFVLEYDKLQEFNGELYFYPQWMWIVEGLLASILLLAQAFAAVYVYCWYRHADGSDIASKEMSSSAPAAGRFVPQTSENWS
ncbi:hypothetical protein [Planctomycetes bacterium K23_9]|uniref:Glycerophosphoryl diester phosphodiesterase membrane domain-containing protein n=1 Tax=Stieleria marina TaxID=1930275 RepID=A0A517NWU9_9BACT|nr:hypothetical protein K239x_36030 [Planctomycetes bacterium K23_9]